LTGGNGVGMGRREERKVMDSWWGRRSGGDPHDDGVPKQTSVAAKQ
jgi:hypothetical protein